MGKTSFKEIVNNIKIPSGSDRTVEAKMIEQLMDTTPNSSFGDDSDAWRDGYVYSRGTGGGAADICSRGSSVGSGYDSTDDNAEEVVTGSQDLLDASTELFVKEEVPKMHNSSSGRSLLSGALAAVKNQLSKREMPPKNPEKQPILSRSRGSTSETASRSRGTTGGSDGTTGSEVLSDSGEAGGCSARHLVACILAHNCRTDTAPQLRAATPEELDLRIAEEGEGVPDSDFPELDPAAAIVDVGVRQFILCPSGQSKPLLIVDVEIMAASLGVSFVRPNQAQEERASLIIAVDVTVSSEHYVPGWGDHRRGSGRSIGLAGSAHSSQSALSNGVSEESDLRVRNTITGEEKLLGELMRPLSPNLLFGSTGGSGSGHGGWASDEVARRSR
jgi:hypothetical protein